MHNNLDRKYSIHFVGCLPNLITREDYNDTSKKIRIRIDIDNDGISILGDSMNVPLLEELISMLNPDEVEQVLCG